MYRITKTAVDVKSLCCFASQTWRAFCNQFEGVVEDFNYGTLLRLDCEGDYTEENSIFGTCASPQVRFESQTQETHVCNAFPVFSHQDSVLGD